MTLIPKLLIALGLAWAGDSVARTAEAVKGTTEESVNLAPYVLAGLAIYLVMQRA